MALTTLDTALMAEAAYWTEAEVDKFLTKRGWTLEAWIEGSDEPIFCFIAVDSTSRDAVLSFRGTEPERLDQWIVDLKARLVTWVNGKRVHHGFHDSVNSIWKELRLACQNVMVDNRKLHITGHSKGAGEGTFACAKFLFGNWPIASLTTFGSPRVGCKNFARWMDERMPPESIQRWVNNNDVVTRVPLPGSWLLSKLIPFWWMLPAGYKHCGELRYVNSDGEIEIAPSVGRLMSDRLKGRFMTGRRWLSDGTRDHNMANYIGHVL